MQMNSSEEGQTYSRFSKPFFLNKKWSDVGLNIEVLLKYDAHCLECWLVTHPKEPLTLLFDNKIWDL